MNTDAAVHTGPTPRPLILTALLDRDAFGRFQSLRRAYYPPALNVVPAHLTLFRHLPGTEEAEIVRRLKAAARGYRSMQATVVGVRNLGGGVAFRIEAPELAELRDALADAWRHWLLPQDTAAFDPHVTIQNKVPPRQAAALHEGLAAGFSRWNFTVEGLTLWRYQGGPWEKLRDFRFS